MTKKIIHPLSKINLSIPVVFQNLAFLAARKSPRIKDRKWVNISNMNPFAIFDPRGFGALEMPTFESRPV